MLSIFLKYLQILKHIFLPRKDLVGSKVTRAMVGKIEGAAFLVVIFSIYLPLHCTAAPPLHNIHPPRANENIGSDSF